MAEEKKAKGAVNPPAVNSPGYEQHEYLDTDVAGHEENFDKDASASVNKRAEADAQIADNAADHPSAAEAFSGPEKDQPDTEPEALAEEKPKRRSRKASDTDK